MFTQLLRYAFALALCGFVAMPDSASAQTPRPETPEAAAQNSFTALAEGRWMDAARLVDPEALVRFREQKLAEWRRAREFRPTTAADFRRHEPEMPEAVAEYMAERAAKAQERFGSGVTYEFAGVSSADELERLSAEEVMARWFQAHDPGYRVQQLIAESGRELPPEAATEMVPRIERTVVGVAPERPTDGDGIAHVVYRTAWMHGEERAPHSSLDVLVVRRTPSGWRVDPTESGGDEGLFGSGFVVSFGMGDVGEQVKSVVTWPAQGPLQGRAYLTGYGEDPSKSPPTALVVERLGPAGPERIEIPAAAFEELMELLGPWSWVAPEP